MRATPVIINLREIDTGRNPFGIFVLLNADYGIGRIGDTSQLRKWATPENIVTKPR